MVKSQYKLIISALVSVMMACNSETNKNNNEDIPETDSSSITNNLPSRPGSMFADSSPDRDYTYDFTTSNGILKPSYQRVISTMSNNGIAKDTFVINPQRDTTLVGSKGTTFFIEALCLETDKREIVKEPVTYVLEEYYSYVDILKAGLSTMSDNHLLETSGMFNIQAFSGKNILRMREGYQILVSPNKEVDKEVELFTAEFDKNGELNWKLDSTAKDPQYLIFPVGGRYHDQEWARDYILKNYRLSQNELKQLVDKTWEGSFYTYHDKVVGISGVTTDDKNIIKAVNTFKKLIPDIFMSFRRQKLLKNVERPLAFQFKVQTREQVLFNMNNDIAMQAFRNFNKGAVFYKNTTSPVIMALNKLGLHNFDKFIRYEEINLGPRTTVTINTGLIPGATKATIMLTDIRSVITAQPGNKGMYLARQVPEKSNGFILVTGAANEKLYLGIARLQPGVSQIISVFDEVIAFDSEEEYQKKMNSVAANADNSKAATLLKSK